MTLKELLLNPLYIEDIQYIARLPLEWNKLSGETIIISGATGMIGRFMTDVILYKHKIDRLQCTVCALGRDTNKALRRFSAYINREDFKYICCNICSKETLNDINEADYILHFASNTHPVAYATDPIGTITANVIGTHNLLELASEKHTKRFLFASSVEIYGENRGDIERFDEGYCGYINCNTLRAGYPESKRCGEALCQAFIKEKEADIVIARLARVFGPTMLMDDSKAVAQFIKKGIVREDIILKSGGKQFFSYCYVSDAVSGILYCLLEGKCGEAYNIADVCCDITLKELANIIAAYNGSKVISGISDTAESTGYSALTKALLNSEKLQGLGWKVKYDIYTGIERTIDIMFKNSDDCL